MPPTAAPAAVLLGAALLVAALGVRAFTRNRVVRQRLLLSTLLLAAFLAMHAVLAWAPLAAEVRGQLVSLARLTLALAAINFLVLVLVNPLRVDRVPERFPTILQDTLTIGLFFVVATLVLDEKFLTTSAVGAVVVGFALQDTLGNMFAGLAIQVEKPFHVGHWVSAGSWEGEVTEISWRATKMRTRQGNLVVVPNSTLAREAITNYSEPAAPTRISVEVGATYAAPPNRVKAAIRAAVAGEPLVLASPDPVVQLADFGASSILYRVLFWIREFPLDDVARDRVRTAIYYEFHRQGIEIPFPIQVEYARTEAVESEPDRVARVQDLLDGVALFAPLGASGRHELARRVRERLYGDGEAIVRQDDAGSSAFVVVAGHVRVTLDPGGQELAVLSAGAYFGEMSLLTGDARTATVRAAGDCRVVEITHDAFRDVVLENPAVVDAIGTEVARRRAGIAAARDTAARAVVQPESATSLIARVKRFLLGDVV